MKYIQTITSWTIILIVSLADISAQCLMCTAQLESAENDGLAMGVNTGILYLLLLPYLLIGTVGFLWYRRYKQKQVLEAS